SGSGAGPAAVHVRPGVTIPCPVFTPVEVVSGPNDRCGEAACAVMVMRMSPLKRSRMPQKTSKRETTHGGAFPLQAESLQQLLKPPIGMQKGKSRIDLDERKRGRSLVERFVK